MTELCENTSESKLDLQPLNGRDVSERLEYNRDNHWPDLTPQHKVFCHEWIASFSLDSARKKAKLSREKASQLLRDPIVAAYCDDLTIADRHDSIFRKQWTELRLLELYEKTAGEVETPHVTRDGDVVMAPAFNANANLGVLKEIAKISKVYPDGAGGSGGVTINLNMSALGLTGDDEPIEISGEVIDADA